MKITTKVRMWTGLKAKSYRYPIVMIDGDQPPSLAGRFGYWSSFNGTRIYHPGLYKWKKIYHRSTRSIEVGKLFRFFSQNSKTVEELLKGIYG